MKVTYWYDCSICTGDDSQSWDVRIGEELPRPCLPNGWRMVLGQLVCHRHRMQADVFLVDYTGARTKWREGVEL